MLTWHKDNIFKIKKLKIIKKKNIKKLKNYEVTCGSYCSPSVNDLNDFYKRDQINHNLEKLGPFWTFQKNEDETKQSLRKLGPKMYLSQF